MDISLSLEPDIADMANFTSAESNVCLSQFLVENDLETRSLLHQKTLMDRFKTLLLEESFTDVQLIGSDCQVF